MSEAAPIRPGEELDLTALAAFLASRAAELELPDPPAPLEALQFQGGKANLTYWIRTGRRELVLRRPPQGPVGPGAHDMGREYRVLSRLWRGYDRAPRAFAYCDDPAVIGAPFFVMERRSGVVVRSEVPDVLREHRDVERRLSHALMDAMLDLHRVDPAALGLEALGRPEGYLERQLAGWARRFALAEGKLADFEALGGWLERHRPTSGSAALVHNDFKLDNCGFDPARPDRVATVFDWDMATRGDPLVDLGTLLGYVREAHAHPDSRQSAISIFARPGFPSRDELAERYARGSGLGLDAMDWYEAFALWKSAVVVQQIFIRYQRGQTRDERFAGFGERVPELVALGLEVSRAQRTRGSGGEGRQ